MFQTTDTIIIQTLGIFKRIRQFVLLARIQGQFTTDLHDTGARVWMELLVS